MKRDDPKAEIGAFERTPGVRAMSDRISEIYKPPANVTIAPVEQAAPRARPLVSTAAAIASANREQAAILKQLADRLALSEARRDPDVVAVGATLEAIARGLEEMGTEGREGK